MLFAVVAVVGAAKWRSIEIAYHRWRFAQEYDAWRHPPVTKTDQGFWGQDFTDTSVIERRLAILVELGAVDRFEHLVRNEAQGPPSPPDFLDRTMSNKLPAHLHYDFIGTPRERQILVIWCYPEDRPAWTQYLKSGG